MTQIAHARPIELLLVEDNPADIRLTREALKDAKMCNNLHVAQDGEEALKFLRRRPPYEHACYPDLILLDLNLPKKDGREVLAEIKADPQLQSIPIVVLTTSAAEEDIVKSYQLHANCYVQKPLVLDRFMEVVAAIENFWLSIVKLPPPSPEKINDNQSVTHIAG